MTSAELSLLNQAARVVKQETEEQFDLGNIGEEYRDHVLVLCDLALEAAHPGDGR